MKKSVLILLVVYLFTGAAFGQVDLDKLDVGSILGKVMKVERGFAPKFYLGNKQIDKVAKVGEIIGIKGIDQANKLFKTFKTGRTVYRVAAYTSSALSIYAGARALGDAAKGDYQGALTAGLTTFGTGLIIKLLTKKASYKAVDMFNGVVRKTIKDIISIAPSSNGIGAGVFVKL